MEGVTGTTTSGWFFDSGCSMHLTGVGLNLKNIEECPAGKVTFCDRKRAKVL